MRKNLITLVALGAFVLGTSVYADLPQAAQNSVHKFMDKQGDSAPDAQAQAGPCPLGAGPCCQPCSYFEDFEGADFVCAAFILGQGAAGGIFETWAASCSANPAFGPASTTQGHVECIAPSFSGTKHVRLSKDPTRMTSPFGCVIDARVPANGPAQTNRPPISPTSMSVEVAITAAGGSDFNVQPQARWQGFSTARVLFFYYGIMYALDNPPGPTGLTFALMGVWDTSGAYQNLTITVDPCAPFRCTGGVADGSPCLCDSDCVGDGGAIADGICNERIHYDYGGGAVVYDGIIYGGVNIDQALVYSDNFGQHMDVDDLRITRDPLPCATMCGNGILEAGEDCEFPVAGGGVCEQSSDAGCPGKCQTDCTCLIQNNDPCDALALANDDDFVKTAHGGWFTFLASAPAYAVETCGSAGYDSRLSIWSSPTDDCNELELIIQNDDCTASYSGSDPLASCFDGPSAVGPPFDSCTCSATTVGERYWVFDDRLNASPVGKTIDILLSKRLACDTLFAGRGACCRACTGVCEDAVLQAACNGAGDTFTANKSCGSDAAGTCTATRGACCDSLDGVCVNCQTAAQCAAANDAFDDPRTLTLGVDCDDPARLEDGGVSCPAATGACCVFDGTVVEGKSCTDNVTRIGCGSDNDWYRDQTCTQVACTNAIPTVSEWGLVIMTLLLLAGAKVYFGRRREALA